MIGGGRETRGHVAATTCGKLFTCQVVFSGIYVHDAQANY